MKESSFVIAAVALPPPVHGQSVVNEAVRNELISRSPRKSKIIDIGPGGLNKGLRYHITRIRRVAAAALSIIVIGLSNKTKVYTVFESGLGFFYNLILLLSARMVSANICIHHHTSFHSLNTSLRFKIVNLVSGDKTTNVVLCDEMAKDLQRRYAGIGKCLTVNNALFTRLSNAFSANKGFAGTIGYISNLTVEKGALHAMEIFRKCRQLGLDIKFFMAGPINDSRVSTELSKVAEDYPEHFSYLGPVYGEAKESFYGSIDLLIFPTSYKYEAQPLVILEAMQFGVPVWARSQGYIKNLLLSSGRYYEGEDEEMMGDCVNYISRCYHDVDFYLLERSKVKLAYENLVNVSEKQFDDFVCLLVD